MKQKILGLSMLFAAMLLSASLVQAGQITATHLLISKVSSPTGDSVVLQVSIVNNSGIGYTNVIAESPFTADVIVLGDMPAGSAKSIQLPINKIAPAYNTIPVIGFDASGLDNAGNAAQFHFDSQGVGQ